MKRSSIWAVMLVFGFVTCVFMAVSLAAEEKEVTVVGVIEKSDFIHYVATDNGKYRIIGQDFSQFIGKKLQITGKVTEIHGGNTLLVTYMEIITN